MSSLARYLALTLALTASAAAADRAPFTLVIVDSPGQPAEALAVEAWRQAQHPSARVEYRWIRIGNPEDARPQDPAPSGSPAVGALPVGGVASPPPVAPEWDPDGAETAPWKLAGLPRVLLLSQGGRILHREAFMSTPQLRYLVRHPDGFPEPANLAKIEGVIADADD